jgi:predicted  nucleic acid-binding Zn-ribbon protein
VQAAIQPAVDRSAKATEKTARDLIAAKVDRQELDQAVGSLQKAIDPLEEQVKAASLEIMSLDENLTREQEALSTELDRLKQDLSVLKSRVASEPAGGVDTDYLDARLLKEQRIFQLKLEQTVREFEQELVGLASRLERVEKRPR